MKVLHKGKRDRYVQIYDTDKFKLRWIHKGYELVTSMYRLGDLKPLPAFVQQRKDTVTLPHSNSFANTVRVVTPDIEEQIELIDKEILRLRKQRQSILEDNFLSMPLLTPDDCEETQYRLTKQEANQKLRELNAKKK